MDPPNRFLGFRIAEVMFSDWILETPEFLMMRSRQRFEAQWNLRPRQPADYQVDAKRSISNLIDGILFPVAVQVDNARLAPPPRYAEGQLGGPGIETVDVIRAARAALLEGWQTG